MDIGTYVSTSSGILQLKKLEVQNNNLANINTVGFKGQYVVAEAQSFDKTIASTIDDKDPFLEGDQARMKNVVAVRTQIDFSQGPIQRTGNPLDAALRAPNEFFVVKTPQGEMFTRAGNFTLSANGTLVTADGYEVQGDGGPIVTGQPGAIIFPDGSIKAGPNLPGAANTVGRLKVVKIDDTSKLQAAEGARFKGVGVRPVPVEPRVEPQSLEMSNVSAVTGMVDLITTNRAFEAYTKAAQTFDALNQTAINQIGRKQQ